MLLANSQLCLNVSNSVFVANQPTFDVYETGDGVLVADYNFYSLPHAGSRLSRLSLGNVYGVSEASFANLAAWQRWSGCDTHSLVGNPLFGNLEGGDLHRPEPNVLEAFQRAVEEHCTSVTLRVEKGGSAASACGQLRIRRNRTAP